MKEKTYTYKIALGLEYLGFSYKGWQAQQGLPTIQASLESALREIAAEEIQTFCAGRTDAGVNAFSQVVHFSTNSFRENHSWIEGTNAKLPADIRVIWAKQVSEDFDARFSALARRYYYFVSTSKRQSVFLKDRLTYKKGDLDLLAMQNAMVYLKGEKDFSAFRASGCQSNSPFREIFVAKVEQRQNLFAFEFVANAFLQHMVRNMVGTILEIGTSKRQSSWLKEVLESKDRTNSGACAPPHGLYFSQVYYPANFDLPFIRGDYADLLLSYFD